jgi:hypothetical protein
MQSAELTSLPIITLFAGWFMTDWFWLMLICCERKTLLNSWLISVDKHKRMNGICVASHRSCHVRSYAPCSVTPCAYMMPNLIVSLFCTFFQRNRTLRSCTARPWKPTWLHRRFSLFYFPMQGIWSGFYAPTAAKSFTRGQIARMHFSCLVCKTRRVYI